MQEQFRERRQRLLEAIHPGVLVVPAAPLTLRNNDVEHEYRQDSDLYYLSGFEEPESVLVLSSIAEKDRFVLFVRARDPEREVWDGSRAGVEGAVQAFGADASFSIAELSSKLPDLLQNAPRLFYRLGRQRTFDDLLLGTLEHLRQRGRRGVAYPTSVVDPATVLHEMRVIKSSEELALMQKAVEITRQAHVEAMALARPGVNECEVEALLRAAFRRAGSERPAYPPIVGSGPNATVLHYRKNDRTMQDGDLLLIDAGCEFGYYASDVTRTFPVSGRFSAAQRAIYEIVLEAQLASIAATEIGKTLEEVHLASVSVIAQGLIALGLIEGPLALAIDEQRYKPFFMHRTSHYLGMDVHDVGSYYVDGRQRPLEAGMVITVEPGIYISETASVDPRYRGIGVRIEDDVLVGREGPVVLSASIPKFVDELETACAA